MKREKFYSAAAGCLLGGALGDALGYEIEFDSWSRIRARFGEAGLQDLVCHDGKARFSDDTQMTLFTNEGMILGYRKVQESGEKLPVEYYVWQSYLCWLKTQTGYAPSEFEKESELLKVPELNIRRAPGNTCLSALSSGEMGTFGKPLNRSKGCGGVMRTAPLGFTDWWGSPLRCGAACAAITHGNPGGYIPAGMLSDMIWRILYLPEYQEAGQDPGKDGELLKKVVFDSLQSAKETWGDLDAMTEFAAMVEKAAALADTDLPDEEAIRQVGEGWVGDEALAVAIYSCLKHPSDPKAVLISAVNHSGDSDSTGAIAGNIIGAFHGLEKLPQEWIQKLELADLIGHQAEKMLDILCIQ